VCVWSRSLRSLRVPLAAVVGLVTSLGIQQLTRLGTDSVDRFSGVGGEGRAEIWRASLSAIGKHPFLGWGPGRIRPAIEHHFTPEFVRRYQTDDFAIAWNDVHNVVLQILVSVGIIGAVLLAVFVAFAMRRSSFALSLAAIAISINWLLQPASLSSLGVAAIFLGASAKVITGPAEPTGRWPRILATSAVVVGLFAALALVTADLNLRRAVHSHDRVAIRAAAEWFGEDPYIIDTFVLRSYRPEIASELPERVAAARRAVAAEPDVPIWWNELAMTQWESEDFEGMRASVEKALELQPNHYRSWVQLTAYAKHVGNTELEGIARTHACDLGAPVCPQG
jgi:hypothetical protein